ncbi:unnamed protein product, partial [Darwinula stevensoni]
VAGVTDSFAIFFGGTSLLILVGVVLDTLQQIESYLLMRKYDGNVIVMIYYKTDEEIELMRESNLLVSKTLAHVAGLLKVGVSSKTVDKEAEDFIRSHGGVPGFKGYRGFPASLCMSVNDAVVHGIPNSTVYTDGDVVSIDCGVILNGFYGDAAFTFAFKNAGEKVEKLLRVTRESLERGISMALVGNRIGDISHAIQHFCERVNGYGIVRE